MVEYFVVGHFVLSFNVSKPQFFFFLVLMRIQLPGVMGFCDLIKRFGYKSKWAQGYIICGVMAWLNLCLFLGYRLFV